MAENMQAQNMIETAGVPHFANPYAARCALRSDCTMKYAQVGGTRYADAAINHDSFRLICLTTQHVNPTHSGGTYITQLSLCKSLLAKVLARQGLLKSVQQEKLQTPPANHSIKPSPLL
jgi:hypothetical protein